MKKRDLKLDIPDKPLYVVCELPDREDHVFRTPSLLTGMKLFKIMDKANLLAFAAQAGKAGKAASPQTMFALMREAGPEVIQALGYLIGVSWHHPLLELDAKESDYKEPLAFGEAVFEELHGEGYDLNQIVMMALCVAANWINRNKVSEEATEKADFFQPPRESTTSPS